MIGPLRTEALVSAGARRNSDDLLLLSPTAGGGQGSEINVYTAWDRVRRDADVAAAVSSWIVDEMQIRKLGVLHPQRSSAEALAAIRDAVGATGGEVVAVEAYAPDSTTFEGPITSLAAAEPDAVVVLADRARTVLQVAPQLVYYGLRRWVIGGDANWSDPSVTRRLDASYADYRVVGTYVDRVSEGTAWQTFENLYEAKYRKSLPNTMFPALGFDAMSLVLLGLPEAGSERRGAVGRAIRRADPHEGATGSLRIDARSGELYREVFVRVLKDGYLTYPDVTEMLGWADEQRELEEFLKALEEEKEEEERQRGRSDPRGDE